VTEETVTEEATLEQQEAAATKIQALFRGIHDREKVKAMKHEQVSPRFCTALFHDRMR